MKHSRIDKHATPRPDASRRRGVIRLRLNLSCLVVLGVLLLIGVKVARPILMRRIAPQEQKDIVLRLQKAHEVIKSRLKKFQATHTRWARSNETYSFLKNHEIGAARDRYIRAKLEPADLVRDGVDCVLFLDNKQISFFRRAVNRNSKQESLSFPDNLIEDFMNQRGVGNDFQEQSIYTLFCRADGVYFVGASPITMSDGRTEVDVQGTLLFVRRILRQEMEDIGREAEIDVKFASRYDTGRYPEMSEALETLTPENPIAVRCSDGITLTAYMAIRDISEEANYILVGTRKR